MNALTVKKGELVTYLCCQAPEAHSETVITLDDGRMPAKLRCPFCLAWMEVSEDCDIRVSVERAAFSPVHLPKDELVKKHVQLGGLLVTALDKAQQERMGR